MSTQRGPEATRERLLQAAANLFAERGFHGTTARDIAGRGAVNLAAGHYHFGSKKDLYLEVLRAEFSKVRRELSRRRVIRPPAELDRLSRPQLMKLLLTRTEVMMAMLIGPPPSLHSTLMQREMCDPSEALPVIVAEFIQPMMEELEQILQRLAPGIGAEVVESCAFSMVGQALFYRFTMPAWLHIKRRTSYPRDLARTVAAHITEFSLGGLERLAHQHGRQGAK
ncbi:MAG: CerR family C-terminal domain-containing protein [Deltaproteobacteria bacterium]|nr:CerR family C-terminal domain-containing protein [Deltaproteobacteria bacterium]